MLDHPKNVGFPTYWHARGYGLFAANNLGQKVLSDGKEELNFRLEAGKSVTFRHQILILNGAATPATWNAITPRSPNNRCAVVEARGQGFVRSVDKLKRYS